MNNGTIAALLRGLCINLTGKPYMVTSQKWADEALAAAMKLEISSGESEESAAKIIRYSYESWKKSYPAASGKVSIPSCVAMTVAGKPEALFWTGSDFDTAQKRFVEINDSPAEDVSAVRGAVINATERADVVKNRIALVTGGAQGIGEEIVRNLAAAGALVFIADLNIEGANKLAKQINDNEKRTAAIGVQVNVANEESVEAMFNVVAEIAGGLDLCISNAGVLKAGSVLEQELSDFKFVTDINYTGFFVICKFAGRLLRTQYNMAPHWNTDIIQVNSKSGLEGSNKNGAYAGGKFGGIGLVASFAMELVEYGIKVNAVCPGNFLDGPLWSDPEKGLFVQYLRTGKVPGAESIADVRAFYESKVPMKRGCTGKDLVRAIYYIVEQEYETGQAVPVTGGQVMLH
jgi:sorbitol-6-phosphate 2-dehydrogenase